MGDKKEEASSGGDNTTRGTDWEVVSLTASAYAASPGPKPPPPPPLLHDAETSHPLYMSRHFVFPPTEQEEQHRHTNKTMDDSDFSLEQETGKEVGGGDLTLDDEFGFFQEEKDKSNDERAFGGSHVYEQSEPVHQQQTNDITPDDDDDEVAAANSPPPPWWKRSAASLLSQAKETNTVWSIFIAAAVMGVVVLGQRWQHDRWQVLQLNWESSIGNEKAGRLIGGPISRLKQAFVGGQRRKMTVETKTNKGDLV
ncbi:hypothetical protein N665_0596s0027 [Sinapis alba]|nr:hypothetical protein N665_0596s0027 [Sinapis alba]KAF8087177.1 hypothetical protein N665_0596s0027 [Sinapis alba]